MIPKIKISNVDEYITRFEKDVQLKLQQMRQTVKSSPICRRTN